VVGYFPPDFSEHPQDWLDRERITCKRYGGKWIAADKVSNLTSVHAQYKTQIPAIERRGYTVGVTSLVFCKWRKAPLKNQSETPYSEAGRDMFQRRTSRKRLLARADELFLSQPTEIGAMKRFRMGFC
jgi:hypothetical protein